MRRRASIPFVLGICLLGSGVQWDMLQVFAWGRMIVDHTRTMTLSEAVTTTFDGEMCSICRAVANAKNQEQSHPTLPEGKADLKVLLFFQEQSPVVVESPARSAWRPVDTGALTLDRSAPLAPPPRQVLA